MRHGGSSLLQPRQHSCFAHARADRPGELAKLLSATRETAGSTSSGGQAQRETGNPVGETGVELTLLTRDPSHCDEIVENLGRWGYPAHRLS